MEKLLNISNGLIQTAVLVVLCFSFLNQHQQDSYDRVIKRIDNLLTFTEQRHNRLTESIDGRLNALEQKQRILEARQNVWRPQ